MELEEKILDATIRIFNRKGLKFTMDDIAAELSISKKTIYTVFSDKKSLIFAMVDYCFGQIKKSEAEVLENPDLSTREKIRRILIVLPDSYKDVDLTQLYALKEKYPETYQKVEERLETGWEQTFALIEQGIREECIRPVNLVMLKTMVEATIEQFFRRDILVVNKISYQDALEEMVTIIMDGICKQEVD